MTLSERNLVISCLTKLRIYEEVYGKDARFVQLALVRIDNAIEIIKHVEIKGPGLPVSAGGSDD